MVHSMYFLYHVYLFTYADWQKGYSTVEILNWDFNSALLKNAFFKKKKHFKVSFCEFDFFLHLFPNMVCLSFKRNTL